MVGWLVGCLVIWLLGWLLGWVSNVCYCWFFVCLLLLLLLLLFFFFFFFCLPSFLVGFAVVVVVVGLLLVCCWFVGWLVGWFCLLFSFVYLFTDFSPSVRLLSRGNIRLCCKFATSHLKNYILSCICLLLFFVYFLGRQKKCLYAFHFSPKFSLTGIMAGRSTSPSPSASFFKD